MRATPRDTKKVSYSTEIRELKRRLSLTDYQRSVLIGSILGDGQLEVNWSGSVYNFNYKLKIAQCLKQKDYVIWKYQIFKDWVLTPPKFDPCNNSYRFRTVSHKEITNLRNIFYRDGRKVIPRDIGSYINPIVLAVWFMDDGNVARDSRSGRVSGYIINSQSFSFEENEILQSVLSDSFGIKCSIGKNKTYARLGIWQEDSRNKFRELVNEFLLPSMQYKLG